MSKVGTHGVYWSSAPDMQLVKEETKELFKATRYNLNSNYENSRSVSTLLNVNNWENFKDTGEKAKSCIESPTIEMWVDS